MKLNHEYGSIAVNVLFMLLLCVFFLIAHTKTVLHIIETQKETLKTVQTLRLRVDVLEKTVKEQTDDH